ncbi:MAG: S8 family serine peptidase [Candidatus Marinimicrobia bacterium]|nr:S8 family serine peptidase [Candidatus Neomarinimicrobiota bacterium]
MIKYIGSIILFISLMFGSEYHSDRILVYVDNALTEFEYYGTQNAWTNHYEINSALIDLNVSAFHPWLPNARANEHDGEVYLSRFYEIVLSDNRSDLQQVINQIENTPGFINAERKPVIRADYVPNDQYFSQQWALPNIQATEAWDLWDIAGGEIPGTNATREIVVGVVDDGAHWTHPDLIANIWNNLGEDADGDGITLTNESGTWEFDPGDINGVDDDGDGFIDNFMGWDVSATSSTQDNDPYVVPGDGHGTNVSGCVSGVTDNSIGVASVGWSVKVMPIKASYASNGFIDNGYEGILTAAQQGADVINCSWGGFGFSSAGQNIVNVCYNTYNAIVVASAGNGNQDYGVTNLDTHYPSGYDNVISVTATGQGDHFNCWATGGTTVDLGAPGEAIRTTSGASGYDNPYGTSFSSPITAGAVALVWSKFPDESKDWVIQKIIDNTDYYADMDRDCTVRNASDSQSHVESMTGMLGSGRLNVFKALAGGIFPSLAVDDINLQNDTDGDGVFNPGETINAKIIVANEEGWAAATDVVAVLSTDDPRVTIIDNTIEFPNAIPSGSSAFTLFDSFQFSATADAVTGNIDFLVTMYAGADPLIYTVEEEIVIELSLNQAGFPFATNSVKSSPIVRDVNGDGNKEIFFGADDFKLYGLNTDGTEISGFPIITGNQVRSSPAIGDVQGDGDLELVFGSKDRSLYIANYDGSNDAVYVSTGYIMDTPVLANVDSDAELEIVFGTFESGSSGKIYVINHDATDVPGFPVDIGEVIMAAPAVDDIDNDGLIDIIVGTWGNNIYALSADGSIKSGFPFATGNRINIAPSLANVSGDEHLEIVAGSDDQNMYIINSSGTEILHIETGGMIKSSPSFYDFNGDNYPEVLFGSQDSHVYAYDVENNQHVSGWPVNVNALVYSSPVIGDIDNDGEPDIVIGNYSGITVLSLSGDIKANMPINFAANVESTPIIDDIDGDNDLEIIVGSSTGLQVIDLKMTAGETASYWNLYRGNSYRTGSYHDINLAIDDNETSIPFVFNIGNAYPNPFNPSTSLHISLPDDDLLKVNIYNILGQEIAVLTNQVYRAGEYTLKWNGETSLGEQASTGIYIISIKYQDKFNTQKVILVK